jgi:hypothetical protein
MVWVRHLQKLRGFDRGASYDILEQVGDAMLKQVSDELQQRVMC